MESDLAGMRQNDNIVIGLKTVCILFCVVGIGYCLLNLAAGWFWGLIGIPIVFLAFLMSCLFRNERKQEFTFQLALILTILNALMVSAYFFSHELFELYTLGIIFFLLSILTFIFYLRKRDINIFFSLESIFMLAFGMSSYWASGRALLFIFLLLLLVKLFAYPYLKIVIQTNLASQASQAISHYIKFVTPAFEHPSGRSQGRIAYFAPKAVRPQPIINQIGADNSERLLELKKLLTQKLISEEEYEELRRRILDSI
ncbi:MAG TPA: hypothetical protein PLU23_00835 [Anaerolineaceae bacterium]|nr:hypothetical protein [Anaerolineaceae bacterium]